VAELRNLSLDAKVVGAMALGNWLLLVANHTVVQVSRDAPLWQLFPGTWGLAWMVACGLLALTYPLRDGAAGARFTGRDRAIHLAAIVALFVVVPTVAEIVLRATGKPYTYVHDGAIMVEEAARKLLAGQDPYSVDYLGTPLFYWPMINNPALYHFTYFPALFLITAPFVALFDRLGIFFDERYLYLPAYLAAIAILPALVPTAKMRLALVAIVALDPQLFPFVAEGRNDFFLLAFLFAGIALMQRERPTLGVLLIAIAASAKLHAALLLPFLAAYLIWRARPLTVRAATASLTRASWPGALLMAVVFVPFLAWDLGGFLDDVVAYNAGGAAWSYPISGMGFSALLRAVGLIEYPQQDFPFWAFQLVAGAAIAAVSLRHLRRDPSIAVLLAAYSATLLAFLFFGRYFQGNYLGYIVAVAAPVPFLRPDLAERAVAWARAVVPTRARLAPVPAISIMDPVTLTSEVGDSPAE
jgi:hypothetical protein